MPVLSADPIPERQSSRHLARIELGAFRNYDRLVLDVVPGPAVFFGPNGAGKTNLLEAASLLSPGRGLRGAKLHEFDNRAGGSWVVRAVIQCDLYGNKITLGHDAEHHRRLLKIDGEIVRRQHSLSEIASILWLTPAQDRIFLEGASVRRRFLDRLVLAMVPDHARQVGLYERSLRERALLLRQRRADDVWLSAIERRMAETAVAIAAARQDLVTALNLELDRRPFARAQTHLSITGDFEAWLERAPALEVEQRFTDALRASRNDDTLTGGAAVGPHRADLAVWDSTSQEQAAQVSTGRQKILLISIVLAEIRLRREQQGESPILLLDEIPAHLDRSHRVELFEVLLDLETQCWMTGTEAELFAPLAGRAAFYRVHDAQLMRDD